MMNRRKLLSSAVALGGSALGLGTGALAMRASATTPTLQIALQNTTNSSQVYAYVTGQAINNNNALMLLEADGHTVYYPSSPAPPARRWAPTARSRSAPPAARPRSPSRRSPAAGSGSPSAPR